MVHYDSRKCNKTLMVINNELYEDISHCGCVYKYAKTHLDEVKQFYSGIEDDEKGDEFWLDFTFGQLWDKLKLNPIFISIFGDELVIVNYEDLDQPSKNIIEKYADENNLDLYIVNQEGYITPVKE